MVDKEVWKDIPGYDGIYQVSNIGRVRSLDRKDSIGRNRKGSMMSQTPNYDKYLELRLNKNSKGTQFSVHRLVALAFIPNPKHFPEINHKDENKQNNCVDNLEWCSHKQNCDYGSRSERSASHHDYKDMVLKHDYKAITRKNYRPIISIDSFGNEKMFGSVKEASEQLGILRPRISGVLSGAHKSTGNYHFKYLYKNGDHRKVSQELEDTK